VSLKHFTVRLHDNFLWFWHAVTWVDSGKPCMLLNICNCVHYLQKRSTKAQKKFGCGLERNWCSKISSNSTNEKNQQHLLKIAKLAKIDIAKN
jgi:hypothetical protein